MSSICGGDRAAAVWLSSRWTIPRCPGSSCACQDGAFSYHKSAWWGVLWGLGCVNLHTAQHVCSSPQHTDHADAEQDYDRMVFEEVCWRTVPPLTNVIVKGFQTAKTAPRAAPRCGCCQKAAPWGPAPKEGAEWGEFGQDKSQYFDWSWQTWWCPHCSHWCWETFDKMPTSERESQCYESSHAFLQDGAGIQIGAPETDPGPTQPYSVPEGFSVRRKSLSTISECLSFSRCRYIAW